jgi:hypothetical protein
MAKEDACNMGIQPEVIFNLSIRQDILNGKYAHIWPV